MPVIEAHHDHRHAVESDGAWSESYYFNAFDPDSDSGFFTRIGCRANDGTIDVGLSIWLPDGRLAECRHLIPFSDDAAGDRLVVGGVTYELLDAMQSWRVSAVVDMDVRRCERGSVAESTVHVNLDVTFTAGGPAIGTDGESHGPQSAESRAAAQSTGKGHFEQPGIWTGTLTVDGTPLHWTSAWGNRDRSWGPRRWGGPTMWRWFSINFDGGPHFGGIRLGTSAGDLHRGWVLADGRATSVAEWQLRTELDDDAVTHQVVHLDVVDKSGTTHHLRGDVMRVADIGRAGGTVVNEGLTRWTLKSDGRVGYGIAEYLHQLDGDGRPSRAVE